MSEEKMDVYINREEMSDYIGITSKDLLSRDAQDEYNAIIHSVWKKWLKLPPISPPPKSPYKFDSETTSEKVPFEVVGLGKSVDSPPPTPASSKKALPPTPASSKKAQPPTPVSFLIEPTELMTTPKKDLLY